MNPTPGQFLEALLITAGAMGFIAWFANGFRLPRRVGPPQYEVGEEVRKDSQRRDGPETYVITEYMGVRRAPCCGRQHHYRVTDCNGEEQIITEMRITSAQEWRERTWQNREIHHQITRPDNLQRDNLQGDNPQIHHARRRDWTNPQRQPSRIKRIETTQEEI